MADLSKIKNGSKFSHTMFGTVEGLDPETREFLVSTQDGHMFRATADVVEKNYIFADQFKETVSVTQSDIIEVFQQNTNIAMTVLFYKKVNLYESLKHMRVKVMTVLSSGDDLVNKIVDAAGELFKGEGRWIVGYHANKQDKHGRVYFSDMEVQDTKQNIRLVDPRTIEVVIVNNVKYVVE